MKAGAPDVPDELIEWKIAFETGWSLEYIRSLSLRDFFNYIQVKDGMIKART